MYKDNAEGRDDKVEAGMAVQKGGPYALGGKQPQHAKC